MHNPRPRAPDGPVAPQSRGPSPQASSPQLLGSEPCSVFAYPRFSLPFVLVLLSLSPHNSCTATRLKVGATAGINCPSASGDLIPLSLRPPLTFLLDSSIFWWPCLSPAETDRTDVHVCFGLLVLVSLVSEMTGFSQEEVVQGRGLRAVMEHELWNLAQSPNLNLCTSGRYSGLKGRKRLKDTFWQ